MTNEDIIKQFEPNREYPSYYHESNVLEAMDAARQDAMEQVINELVEWMKQRATQSAAINHISEWYAIGECITHAKSLLNQQVEETKLNP